MAQKSLPILNKVNTSMVWYTTYYYKYYKWLSSQNLYLLYFFNKLFVYLDFLFIELMWLTFYQTWLYTGSHKTPRIRSLKQKFLKPVTSYLVMMETQSIFINIYYKTSLERFQNLDKEFIFIQDKFYLKLQKTKKLQRVYFR